MYGLLRGLHRVLIPGLSVVTAQDHDLSLLAPQRRKVGHLNDDRAVGTTTGLQGMLTNTRAVSLHVISK